LFYCFTKRVFDNNLVVLCYVCLEAKEINLALASFNIDEVLSKRVCNVVNVCLILLSSATVFESTFVEVGADVVSIFFPI